VAGGVGGCDARALFCRLAERGRGRRRSGAAGRATAQPPRNADRSRPARQELRRAVAPRFAGARRGRLGARVVDASPLETRLNVVQEQSPTAMATVVSPVAPPRPIARKLAQLRRLVRLYVALEGVAAVV